MRCGHSDRDAAVERLRVAGGDGYLDPDELDERLGAALRARTLAELDALLEDLPAPRGRAGLPLAPEVLRLRATVSDRKQTGRWVVPRQIVAETGIGTVKIDFTEAECRHDVVEVEVAANVGSVVLVVPAGWSARTDGVGTGIGSVKNRVGASGAGPLLVVRGSARIGDVVVRHPRRVRWLPR